MQHRRAISPIIGALMVVVVVVGVISLVLLYGLPRFLEWRELTTLRSIEGFMISLDDNIRTVASEGPGSTRVIQFNFPQGSRFIVEDPTTVRITLYGGGAGNAPLTVPPYDVPPTNTSPVVYLYPTSSYTTYVPPDTRFFLRGDESLVLNQSEIRREIGRIEVYRPSKSALVHFTLIYRVVVRNLTDTTAGTPLLCILVTIYSLSPLPYGSSTWGSGYSRVTVTCLSLTTTYVHTFSGQPAGTRIRLTVEMFDQEINAFVHTLSEMTDVKLVVQAVEVGICVR